jgi:hypothetical protein
MAVLVEREKGGDVCEARRQVDRGPLSLLPCSRHRGDRMRLFTPPTPAHYAMHPFAAHPVATAIAMLVASNVFMTFAWYAHLKNLNDKPWWIAAFASWGIALFEYLLQVPANRVGFTALSLGQLKILQEVITLAVFVPFALFYMNEPLKWNYLWAALCVMGAVYFIFRA